MQLASFLYFVEVHQCTEHVQNLATVENPFTRGKLNNSYQVNYALGAIYYLCNASNKEEIMKPEVVDVINKYAVAESVSFSNLAKAILDKHLSNRN